MQLPRGLLACRQGRSAGFAGLGGICGILAQSIHPGARRPRASCYATSPDSHDESCVVLQGIVLQLPCVASQYPLALGVKEQTMEYTIPELLDRGKIDLPPREAEVPPAP